MSSEWHLSKNVTVTNIIAIALAVVAMVGSYYTLDKRLAIVELSQVTISQQRLEERNNNEKEINRVVNRLDKIESLLLQLVLDRGK